MHEYDNRLDLIENIKYTLAVADLSNKFGFNDGELFELLCERFPELPSRYELLEEIFRVFYLPLLNKSIKTRKANSSHNQLRVDGDISELSALSPKEITVTATDIIKHFGIDKNILKENVRVQKEIERSDGNSTEE
tara:strand:+ start:13372 stop:13779 length:408 start_codon:yes stop_codon:yes gene_type:complete